MHSHGERMQNTATISYLGSRSLYSSLEMDANACFRFALKPDGGSFVSLMHLSTAAAAAAVILKERNS